MTDAQPSELRHRGNGWTRLWNGDVRAALLVVGGVLVLQSSDALTPPKVIYLVIAAVVVGRGLLAVAGARPALPFAEMRPLFATSLVVIAVLALSLLVAIMNGTPLVSWLRDSVSYGLFSVVAFVGFDAAFKGRSERATGWPLFLIVTVGAIVTLSYTAAWTARRDIVTLPIDLLVLPSGGFASAFAVVTSAFSFRAERHRYLWAMAAGLALGLFLITGTRGRLPFLLLPILFAAMSRTGHWRAVTMSLLMHAAMVMLVVLASWGIPLLQSGADDGTTVPGSAAPGITVPKWTERAGSIDDLITNPMEDASFRERLSQTVAAWKVFSRQPLIGAGPGVDIEWVDYAGETQRGYTLDTPVVFLAKFGLVGLAVAAAWVATFVALVRRIRARISSTPEYLALVGFSIVLVYAALFSPPMQDKGVAFALILTLALALRRAYGGESPATGSSQYA